MDFDSGSDKVLTKDEWCNKPLNRKIGAHMWGVRQEDIRSILRAENIYAETLGNEDSELGKRLRHMSSLAMELPQLLPEMSMRICEAIHRHSELS